MHLSWDVVRNVSGRARRAEFEVGAPRASLPRRVRPMRVGRLMGATRPTRPTRPMRPMRPTRPTRPTRSMRSMQPMRPMRPMRPMHPTRLGGEEVVRRASRAGVAAMRGQSFGGRTCARRCMRRALRGARETSACRRRHAARRHGAPPRSAWFGRMSMRRTHARRAPRANAAAGRVRVGAISPDMWSPRCASCRRLRRCNARSPLNSRRRQRFSAATASGCPASSRHCRRPSFR